MMSLAEKSIRGVGNKIKMPLSSFTVASTRLVTEKPDVPFYFPVEMESEDDIQCRAAEWYRRRAIIRDNLQRNELVLEAIGQPSWLDDFDLMMIRQSKQKIDEKKVIDQQGVRFTKWQILHGSFADSREEIKTGGERMGSVFEDRPTAVEF